MKKYVVSVAVIATIIGGYIAYTQFDLQNVVSQKEKILGKDVSAIVNVSSNDDISDERINSTSIYRNNYYNKMKIANGWVYYCDGELLRKYSLESGEDVKIAEGDFWLGEMTDQKLYMLSMPLLSTKEKETADIMCLELESDEINKLYTIEENIWGYCPPFIDDNNLLFCEEFWGEQATCHFYKEAEENGLQEVNGDTSIYSKEATSVREGTGNSLLNYDTYSCLNTSTHKLELNDSNGVLLAEIDADIIDSMFTPKGFVYTDKDMNIHLVTIYDKSNVQDTIIYRYDGTFVNYATSDENGIYGYITSNQDVQVIQLDWTGKMSILSHEIGDKNDIARADLSAFGGVIAYCWNDEMRLITKFY